VQRHPGIQLKQEVTFENMNFRLGMVSSRQIKRMPGLKIEAPKKRIEKARDFVKRRGCYMPVVVSDADGCMTLLAGEATFKVCLEEKKAKVPAFIVQTEGCADNLMFALQSAEIVEPPDPMSVSAVIVQLIDAHGVSRKHIAESLGKSAAWVNRMECLSRKLNDAVQRLVAEGHVTSRLAQEIARLPDGVQAAFAISAGNEFLSKDNATYLVNRYLDEDASPEERDRIINTPRMALPIERANRKMKFTDCSDSARLSRAMARCLDDASYLSRLLERIDMDTAAIRVSDAAILADNLAALCLQLQVKFLPGKKTGEEGL